MPLNKNPVFRKAIVPWYDSETICFAVLIFLAATGGYGLLGVTVALQTTPAGRYLWVPVTLLILSIAGFVSTLARLLKRYFER